MSAAEPLQPTTFSPAARGAIEVLAAYTAFPQVLFSTVCERHGVQPDRCTAEDVEALIGPLAIQIATFNDVEAAFVAKRRLLVAVRMGAALR